SPWLFGDVAAVARLPPWSMQRPVNCRHRHCAQPTELRSDVIAVCLSLIRCASVIRRSTTARRVAFLLHTNGTALSLNQWGLGHIRTRLVTGRGNNGPMGGGEGWGARGAGGGV